MSVVFLCLFVFLSVHISSCLVTSHLSASTLAYLSYHVSQICFCCQHLSTTFLVCVCLLFSSSTALCLQLSNLLLK